MLHMRSHVCLCLSVNDLILDFFSKIPQLKQRWTFTGNFLPLFQPQSEYICCQQISVLGLGVDFSGCGESVDLCTRPGKREKGNLIDLLKDNRNTMSELCYTFQHR